MDKTTQVLAALKKVMSDKLTEYVYYLVVYQDDEVHITYCGDMNVSIFMLYTADGVELHTNKQWPSITEAVFRDVTVAVFVPKKDKEKYEQYLHNIASVNLND